jgi:hypothetical protein
VDFSSIHPENGARHRRAAETTNGMGWIDAPVCGGTMGAEEGTLAVMTGGDASNVERVRPYVLPMAAAYAYGSDWGGPNRKTLQPGDRGLRVPMAGLPAQLFRLAQTARGSDADALEIYKLSETRIVE